METFFAADDAEARNFPSFPRFRAFRGKKRRRGGMSRQPSRATREAKGRGAGRARVLGGRGGGPRVRAVASLPPLLVLLLLAPHAAAQSGARTLSSLEEPVVGTDLVFDVTVGPEEAGTPANVVFLNAPGKPFGLVVYRRDGTEAYSQSGARGVQPFPALEEGTYKVYVRGTGAFQLTPNHLGQLRGRPDVMEVNATLSGADAYVFAPTRDHVLHVEGSVRAELRDLAGATRDLAMPAAHNVSRGSAYVLTLRGDEGSAYRVWLEPVGPEPDPAATVAQPSPTTPPNDTPLGGVPLLLAGAACAALALRRRR